MICKNCGERIVDEHSHDGRLWWRHEKTGRVNCEPTEKSARPPAKSDRAEPKHTISDMQEAFVHLVDRITQLEGDLWAKPN